MFSFSEGTLCFVINLKYLLLIQMLQIEKAYKCNSRKVSTKKISRKINIFSTETSKKQQKIIGKICLFTNFC